jgi:signal transduction histidine kinase
VKAFPVINEEGILIGAVHVSRNITESKKIEEEMARLERMNLIGEMAAGFGHEIRNPLATVKGFLQILYGKEDCTRYREFLDLMIEEMDRANSIISEFLSMAKHKAIDLKAHNLVQIIQSLFPLMLADAIHGDKSIELELQDVPHVSAYSQSCSQRIGSDVFWRMFDYKDLFRWRSSGVSDSG